MTPYRASGKAPFFGIILLLILTVVSGIAIGAAAYFISKFIYLIVLFPLVMIALGGAIVSFGVKQGKIRSRPVALFFGILMAVLIYGSYRVGEYIGFREELYNYALEQFGDSMDRDTIDQFVDEELRNETGDIGFVGYTRYAAQQGIDISYRATDIHLDETATWIYWALEALALLVFTPMLPLGAAAEPFCESCNRWYDGDSKRMYVGNIPAEGLNQFKGLMGASDARNAAAMISPKPQDRAMVHLYAYRCGDCVEGDVLLKGIRQTQNRNKTSEVAAFTGLVQPQVFDGLMRVVQAKTSTAGSPAPSAVFNA